MRSATSSRAGFTLMELMTVVVVVSVLAAMFLPLMDHFRQKSEVVVCTQNLKGLHVAGANYVNEFEHWPQMNNKLVGKPEFARAWHDAFAPYGIAPVNWACPSVQRMMKNPDLTKPDGARVDYHATPFDQERMTPYKWPTQPWFVEVADFHGDGPLIIFCTGQVKSLKQFLRDSNH